MRFYIMRVRVHTHREWWVFPEDAAEVVKTRKPQKQAIEQLEKQLGVKCTILTSYGKRGESSTLTEAVFTLVDHFDTAAKEAATRAATS